jgi:FlaA1/EpsC-like NDP-sugar epimerase
MESNIKFHILRIPRVIKRLIVMVIDCSLAVYAVWFSYYLRIGDFPILFEGENEHYALPACIASIVVFLPIFVILKLYNEIFHFSGTRTSITIVKAITLYGIIYSLLFTFIGIDGVPRTVGIIQPIIFMLLILFSRFFALLWLGELYNNQWKRKKRKHSLIYGAGEKGRELMKALSNSTEINVVGFLDDDPKLHNNKINGLNVYNPIDIKKIIAKKSVNEIMLILNQINRERRNDIFNLLKGENIVVRTLPSYSDLAQGKVTINDLNDLSISDLLGRDPVKPNPQLMQYDITDKIILVTGAGGSIGSEICRQICKQKPKRIVLLEQSEFALYKILQDLKNITFLNDNHIDIIARLGSITDKILIRQILKEIKPETIFHAAAYKHVPIVESNILEGLQNNVFGTLVLAHEAIANGVKKFIFISSDKAVRPTNVMGASKRLAEMILQALSAKKKKTNFAIVRFGNVLDSSGSVVPLFKSQIKSGGPITVTHRDITRYFMTISEAAELVIQAGAMIADQKKMSLSSPIYLLDMGEPIKIFDLAKLMIKLSGLVVFDRTTNKGDIEIQITGTRPGEKLYEELLIGDAKGDTVHPKIKYAHEEYLPWLKLNGELLRFSKAIRNNDQTLVIQLLKKIVIGFKHDEI